MNRSLISKIILKVEESKKFLSIQHSFIAIIPIIMIGSFALVFRSLPLPLYQKFLLTNTGTILDTLLNYLYHSTLGMISIYVAASIGYFMERNSKHSESIGLGAMLISVGSFLIAVGFLTDSFDTVSFGASGMLVAILCSTFISEIYIKLLVKFHEFHEFQSFSDGSDPYFNKSIASIIPMVIVFLGFSILSYSICMLFGASNLWVLFAKAFTGFFSDIGENFWGGLLYVFLINGMWFFGIHGSNVLESVNMNIFVPAAKANAAAVSAGFPAMHIYTKTFFDVFVLMGGCGTLLCLLIAVLLFSKRRNNRSLAKTAIFPMLFNVNEIMVFGLPIIYNPYMLIPFIGTPIAGYLIASFALKVGLVPLTITSVEWTTPIFIGGYQSTGSISGVVLQLVILIVGVAIYHPFVKLYDNEKKRQSMDNISNLINIYKKNEFQNKDVTLTELDGIHGAIAKQLASDIKVAVSNKEMFLLYQPQFSYSGKMFGAEALLRWNHEWFGYIYPPLIIKLASEAGILDKLEKYIYTMTKNEISEVSDILFSVNVTTMSLQDDSFINFLIETFPQACAGKARICIEITEQGSLSSSIELKAHLMRLKENGFKLAIDDFSMGHTSLKYLREGKFDEVKIDGSLSKDVLNESNVKDIISSIVFLSKAQGFSVLAEYVETKEQKEVLASLGCLQYQGYLYSPPITIGELKNFLTESNNS